MFVIAGQSQEAAAATRRPAKLGTLTLWPFTERLQAPHLPQMLSAVPQGPPQWPVPCSARLCLPSCLCILQALPGAFPSEASVARQGGLPKSTVCSDEEPHHSLRRRRNGRPFGLRLCRSPLRLPKGELLAGGRCPGHVSGGGRWLAHSSTGMPGTPEDWCLLAKQRCERLRFKKLQGLWNQLFPESSHVFPILNFNRCFCHVWGALAVEPLPGTLLGCLWTLWHHLLGS